MPKYQTTHEIIVGGDFNENISGTSTTKRATLFRDFIRENEFTTVYNDPAFMNVYGADVSEIDYLLYKQSKCEEKKVRKLANLNPNTSDHYPLLVSMNCNLVTVKPKQTLAKPSRVNWQKIDKLAYASKVSEGLKKIQQKSKLETECEDNGQIDLLIAETVTVLNTAAESCSKRKKPS